jgi:hypothetical protein
MAGELSNRMNLPTVCARENSYMFREFAYEINGLCLNVTNIRCPRTRLIPTR